MSSSSSPCQLSVIIPVLNEVQTLPMLLARLQRMNGVNIEIMVVDGGSDDGSAALIEASGVTLVRSPPGRALQLNAGAAVARGELLWFLHADTGLPIGIEIDLKKLLENQSVWGRFDVRLSGDHYMYKVIAALMNLRSRLSGIATGDQGIFVRRDVFSAVGGFAPLPLMEDIDLSRRLKRIVRPTCLRTRLTTSSRRWQRHGIWRTIFLMWQLRWRYWRGVSPSVLAQSYRQSDG